MSWSLSLCRSTRSVCEACGPASSRSWCSYGTGTRNEEASRTPSRRWGTWWTRPATSRWATPCESLRAPRWHHQGLYGIQHLHFCCSQNACFFRNKIFIYFLNFKKEQCRGSRLFCNLKMSRLYLHTERDPVSTVAHRGQNQTGARERARQSATSPPDAAKSSNPAPWASDLDMFFVHVRRLLMTAWLWLCLEGTCHHWRHRTQELTVRSAASGEAP